MIAEHKFSEVKKDLLEKYLIHSEEKKRERNELFNLSWLGLAQPEEPNESGCTKYARVVSVWQKVCNSMFRVTQREH